MNRGLATRLKLMNPPITRCQFTHMRPATSAHLTPSSLLLAAALFGLGTMNLAEAPGSDGGATWTLLTGANGSGGAVSAATAAAFDVVIRNAIPQKTTESAGYYEKI